MNRVIYRIELAKLQNTIMKMHYFLKAFNLVLNMI